MKTAGLLATIASRYPEGSRIHGRVTRFLEYGCFVDVEDGVEGFLHITDMRWTSKLAHPSDVVSVGELVEVMVLSVNEASRRLSLGLKQCQENPWKGIAERYPEGSRLEGRVTRIVDYGCFVDVEEGIEGIVHVSEMHWTDRNMHPSKMVAVGDLVEVMVLDIHAERGRFSLGLKQCHENPWELFAATHKKNDNVSGTIQSVTNMGLFVELEGGAVGHVFPSDILRADGDEVSLQDFSKGDDIDGVVLSIDAERERICLRVTLN